ncbi:hypothetical protein FOZ63_001498 [Perkinsus olseni]|uniref:Uncharacterized protein n=1 Tax=Perkinsus olseni TaxID=32597 RepID=A0A7J6QBB0_PEROL|nr:hypothetical protein FOZ63_001498 [Perkinsus olseni]
MLIIDKKTKETVVLRVNGHSQNPKASMYFENIMAGLLPIEQGRNGLRECCPTYEGSMQFALQRCNRPVCTQETVTEV